MRLIRGLVMSRKAVVGVVVGILALGAAVGTFASQDALPLVQSGDDSVAHTAGQDGADVQGMTDDGDDNDEDGQREVVGIPEDNPSHEDGDANGNGECDKGETAIKTTPSGNEVRVPCHAVEHGQREVVGIPEDNPHFQADDQADDETECEKGVTAIKETPSGNQVRVPCHAVEPGAPSFSHGHKDGDDGSNGDESGDGGEED